MFKMKIKILILIYILLINVVSQAQENDLETRFIEVRKDNHYGLFDTSGKEILASKYDGIRIGKDEFIVAINGYDIIIDKTTGKTISSEYKDVDNFHEGLAKVNINEKYGYIDKTGKLVIEAIYSSAASFSEGLAMVRLKDNKSGFIDKTGKLVIPFQYDNYWECFKDGLACVRKNDKETLIDKTGKEIMPYKYDGIFNLDNGFYEVRINHKYGIIDKQGNEIVPTKYHSIWGMGNNKIYFRDYNMFGSLDLATGKEIFSVENSDFKGLIDGNIIINQNLKYGVINNKQEVLIDFKYNYIKPFTEKFMLANLKGKFGVLNLEGEEILGFEYDHILACSEDIFAVGQLKEKDFGGFFLQLNIIDKNMKKITSASYLNVGVFSEGMLMVEYGEGGIEKAPPDCILASVRCSGQWGFINEKGIEVVAPQYERVKKFSQGLAAVQDENEKWGFVNKEGKVIIPIKYDFVQNFKNELSIVRLNKKWGVIDKTGKIIIPIEYDSIDNVPSIWDNNLNQPYEGYYKVEYLFY